MIVKNEAHVLTRLLTSVAPIIDYWVIVDTGSTDGTQELIKNFFAEKGIPGELKDFTWIDNFAAARNFALNAVEDKVDYGFWIDADEELIVEPTFNKSQLDTCLDSFSIRTVYGKVDYTRKNFWKTKKGFSWSGPIHELLSSPEEKTGDLIKGMHVIVRPEGASWGNIKEKYLSHAKILEEYVSRIPDPRWIFYTAQSYRDASEYEKSIEWYRKRAAMTTGFPEEIYISRLMIAKLSEMLNKDKGEIAALYQEALTTDPVRGESSKALIQFYQRHGKWELAYVNSLYGLRYHGKNPYPNRILFLDSNLYDYEMLELHALSCFYSNRKEEASRAYWSMRDIVSKFPANYFSETQWKLITDNEKYFPKPVSQKAIQPSPVPQARKGFRTPPKKKR